MKQKYFPFLLSLLMSMAANVALAYDVEIDGIYYNLSGTEATVTYKDENYNSYSGMVTIPESFTYEDRNYHVKVIGTHAFTRCSGLTSVTIPNSITSLGDGAFVYCSSLTFLNIPNSVAIIGNGVFQNSALTYINIPESVTSIGSGTFYGCTKLTSVTIPENMTSIVDGTFMYCYSLTSVTIPNSVTSIGSNAFLGCRGLTSITIPESVSSIDVFAFGFCSGLKSIIIGMKTPINISEDTFGSSYEVATLYVPKGCRTAYEAADPWNRFTNISEYYHNAEVENQSIMANNSTLIDINVNNSETNLVGFQMDLMLPEGVGIDKTGCSLSSRITDENQELTIGKLDDGTYRLTSTSLSLTPISGNDGTLLVLKLTAENGCVGGQATISNIRFSTSESEKIIMDNEVFDISILYNLTYKVDGEEYKTKTIAYGTAITPEPAPTKEGYTFSGWSGIPATMPAHDVEVTGTFTINQYTVKFLDWDGTVISETSLDYHSTITVPADPVREGYTFTGWDTEVPSVVPAHDVTFIATYSVNSYTLTYILDGETYKTYIIDYGTAITPEAAPTKEGYTFSGWSEIPETMPAHDVDVTGTFSINSYTLTYKVDGEEYKSFIVVFGTAITPEAEPTKEGYTFSGWSEIPETMPAHDVTVTGSFTINSYKLTYVVDGVEYKSLNVVYGTAITPEAAPTKEGYTFSGWSEIPETMPAHDVEVTGSFTVNYYTLTYIVDGEEYETLTAAYGTAITPEAEPTKEGYTFSGWSEIPETMPAHDVEVTGSFTVNYYTLTYIVDGEEYETMTAAYGTAITPEAEPTKEGYTFSGWSDIPETMPAHDVIVTGSFIINQYTLAYIIDGEEYKSFKIDYNAVIVPISAPVKKGMIFSGWTEIPERMPAHDVTVTGKYSWAKETIDYVIYQVTDTLNNYASVIGNEDIEGKAEILSTVEIGGDIYTVNCIDRDAFAGCTGLTSIIIPENVISIGSAAFEGCTSLQEIYCYAEQTPEVDLDAFDSVDVSSVMLVVPDNSVEEYKAHFVWGLFWIETPTDIREIKNEELRIKNEANWYDLNGRKLAEPQKGINIIRYSDGTSRKVLR